MELKLYKVNLHEDCNYYILAYSWEHALVLMAELVNEWPDEFNKDDIVELSKKEYKNIIMDYNFIEDKTEQVSIGDYIKRKNKTGELKHGVLTDDFVNYL